MRFQIGDKVRKPKGYPYPGTVVSAFTNLKGETRYDVENSVLPGMIHIFNEGQLEHDPEGEQELEVAMAVLERRRGLVRDAHPRALSRPWR